MTKVQVNSQGKAYITNGGKVLLSNTTLTTKNITQNGTYNASSDSADGYSSVTVNVSSSSPVITSLNVTPTTSAQTITAPSGTDGYSPVNVAAVTSAIDANIQAGNIKKDVQILGVTGTYEGSGGGGGNYALLDRVSDDGGNEIGTVSGFFTDANGVEYAVVCLDAQYRPDTDKQYLDDWEEIPNLPYYEDLTLWTAKQTATFNCDKILATPSHTSSAVEYCRTKSFIINGNTYYGQLPNLLELVDIFRNRVEINSADTSASQYSSLALKTNKTYWSSTQQNYGGSWTLCSTGDAKPVIKSDGHPVTPILEIPNAV